LITKMKKKFCCHFKKGKTWLLASNEDYFPFQRSNNFFESAI
jgi:hypothetical protein